jgi:DNA ligase-1
MAGLSMRRFCQLYEALDGTTRTNAKVEAMVRYLEAAPAEDAAWAVFFLTGQRLKRLISGRTLRAWAEQRTGLPEWLVSEAHAAIGDSAETAALLLPDAQCAADPGASELLPLHRWLEERILPLRGQPAEGQYAEVCGWWQELPRGELLVLNKLLTGAFRVGVSKLLVVRALAEVAGLPRATVAHRLMGRPQPSAAWYRTLVAPAGTAARARPYPFFLASPLDARAESLGPLTDWLAEWKWDGIRGQLMRRSGEVFLWSRGEELITERFPELIQAAARLPDGVVLDGEVLAWGAGVLPFAVLQRRIGRDRLTQQLLRDAPVAFLAYDLLEERGVDLRALPFAERRARLEKLVEVSDRLLVSPEVSAESWDELAALRAQARDRRVEGLMLKRRDAPYGVGRQRGAWWKWKVAPLTLDAVLVYAQAGSGRRAGLFTDYTFAVWRGEELVPVAKAYSGLSEQEIAALDRWICANTVDRFGPVRQVEAVHVFELAFEGINRSTRHKSGVALRFPRIARWRTDKRAAQADRLEQVHALLDPA